MAQTEVTSFFNTRKRAATDDLSYSKNKVFILDSKPKTTSIIQVKKDFQQQSITRVRKVRKINSQIPTASAPIKEDAKQTKLVKFIKRGNLSPKKQHKPTATVQDELNTTPPPSIPTKPTVNAADLSTEAIKKKLQNSSRLSELLTSVNKLRDGLQKLDKLESKKSNLNAKNLKKFEAIEFEFPVINQHNKTPVKDKQTPSKNLLVSPREVTPKKLLLSPSKNQLIKTTLSSPQRTTLALPFKHRSLLEIFKFVDIVCAMFYNRREKITFKKLKPAVQRMLRKNIHESHLGQIHHLYPKAFTFTQEKTRNFGSATKEETYQLVIKPNINSEDTKSTSFEQMSSKIMTERYKVLHDILIENVKIRHEEFLKTLNPPLIVKREQITRWHPDFDLENSVQLIEGELPRPPNVEKFSSAKDVLSTARNLFNSKSATVTTDTLKPPEKLADEQMKPSTSKNFESPLLKNIPTALLEKIRAKKAAKDIDLMTRRPSTEKELVQLSRLPDIVRHLRNIFVTEKKGVLPLDVVLVKIENSYRGSLTLRELEEHLKSIAKIVPNWLSFHEVRKAMFVKISKDTNVASIISCIEKKIQSLS
uniref:Putative double parked n=1 Tax=Corethrella appendiculata TaxID=1370023 RepID=U5EZH4_9DIPT